MAVDGVMMDRAREALARTREKNAALRRDRQAEVAAAIPEMPQLEAQLRGLMPQVLDLILHNGADRDQALAWVDEQSQTLLAMKRSLLECHGFPADYLDEIVSCSRCRDSGRLPNGTPCDCLLARYEAERKKALSSQLSAWTGSFDDFSLDYYTGEDRVCMELTLTAARAYALGFGPDSPNLLFQGGTGLGKTFLSGCVAREVSARGYSVVYETVQNALAAFEEQKFSRDAETYAAASDKVRRILGCDLLILDDLGTELTTSFTQSALYNIVNTRLTERRQTIISTNLSDTELAQRYMPQTVSRLSGEYDTLLFRGRDIRAIRREHRHD